MYKVSAALQSTKTKIAKQTRAAVSWTKEQTASDWALWAASGLVGGYAGLFWARGGAALPENCGLLDHPLDFDHDLAESCAYGVMLSAVAYTSVLTMISNKHQLAGVHDLIRREGPAKAVRQLLLSAGGSGLKAFGSMLAPYLLLGKNSTSALAGAAVLSVSNAGLTVGQYTYRTRNEFESSSARIKFIACTLAGLQSLQHIMLYTGGIDELFSVLGIVEKNLIENIIAVVHKQADAHILASMIIRSIILVLALVATTGPFLSFRDSIINFIHSIKSDKWHAIFKALPAHIAKQIFTVSPTMQFFEGYCAATKQTALLLASFSKLSNMGDIFKLTSEPSSEAQSLLGI